jgi:hypothetical protein
VARLSSEPNQSAMRENWGIGTLIVLAAASPDPDERR